MSDCWSSLFGLGEEDRASPQSPSLRLVGLFKEGYIGSEIVVIKVDLAALIASFGEFNASFLIIADSLFEEVGFALQRNHVHPLERILNVVNLGHPKGEEQSISNELDVLGHQFAVHANQFNWQ